MKGLTRYVSAAALAMGMAGAQAADIVFIVDESGSMSGEHAWLSTMVSSLDSELVAAGESDNRYALVGYGASNYGGHTVAGHAHTVGTGDFGTAADLSAATGGLVINGGTEDGWEAINFALNHYTFTSSAINFILVTDEDRDNINYALSYAGMETALVEAGVVLNAVVNVNVKTDTNVAAVGADDDGNAYVADGAGGYTTATLGSLTPGDYYAATSVSDYSNLAFATGGATWDLNQLRAGGLLATSFTNAFVDIKVQEIISQTPEPSSLLLMTLGLVGIGARRLRK